MLLDLTYKLSYLKRVTHKNTLAISPYASYIYTPLKLSERSNYYEFAPT
jgi:hypothetical protein